MIRTIVVDDEPYIRQSIITCIENTNPNFKVIAQAGNGLQAYELIHDLQPDVVFLDIRMPILDGISLLEKLQQNHLFPIRVILSGYSEFEYAKKAVHYQVFDYILKPIHLEQMEALLNNISERIMKKSLLYEYQYFNHVFKGIKPSLSWEKLCAQMNNYKAYYCFYLILGSYMYTKNNQFNPSGVFPNTDELVDKLTDNCTTQDHVWAIAGENQNEVLFILGAHGNSAYDVKQLAAQIHKYCSELPTPITLIYPGSSLPLENMTDAVIDLKYYAMQKIRYAYTTILALDTVSEANSDCILIDEKKYSELQKMIHEQRYQEYKHSVKKILQFFCQQKIPQNQLRRELIRLLEVLHNGHFSYDIQEFIDESITNTYLYEDLTELMLQYIDAYSRNYYLDLSQNLTEQIRNYIDENYQSQLTLKKIASCFHISASYLSTLFKKAYGLSPNEYLMNKRITKARDLLTAFPPISIKQISVMVGYTDPYYFSRIFKMITGISPTEYRDSHYSKQPD